MIGLRWRIGVVLALLLAAAAAAWGQSAATAEPRIALVIGNSRYPNAPLTNPANDAEAVAKALRRAGFTVDLRIDANQRQMDDALRAFGDQLRGHGVGLFYFAGHGAQIKGRNFLLPVGNEIRREDEVPFKSLDVQQVLDKMEAANNRLNVVILDACRDNPFASGSRSAAGSAGLSQIDAPVGSLIAFATAPGRVASDGKGANGLYTEHLLANIEQPGMPIEEVFKRTRLGVRLDSNGQQVPWESTSLEGDFSFFAAAPGARRPPAILPPPPAVEQIVRAEQAYELLRQGKLADADKLFRELTTTANPEVVLMGREGLAEVMLQRGDAKAALAAANDIIARAPARSAAYLIRGRALSAAGRAPDAMAALQQAASPATVADFSWQRSDALVSVGNLQRKQDPAAAVKSYERAASETPHSVTALSNLAVALNQTGQPARAKQLLERAQALDPTDAMTAALLRQVRDSLADEQDLARQRYIDDAVKELSARFRAGDAQARPAGGDDWTSPALAISVLPFQDQTNDALGGRVGFDSLLQQALIGELQSRGFTLVERRLLDKVLAEVKLGASALADQDTQIRLGRVLAARLMLSGSVGSAADDSGLVASLRAIDTETTRLVLVRSDSAPNPPDASRLAATMAQAVVATVAEAYPLKGRIVAVDGDDVIINLGKKQGVAPGQAFNVLLRGEPIELNGRVLGYKDQRIARLVVTEVDELLSHTRVEERQSALEKNQRIVARKP